MLSIKDYNRKKDSAILLIFSIVCIALATISYPNYTNTVINNSTSNSKNYNSTIIGAITTVTNNLFTNILAKNLEDHLKKAGAILDITSKLPQEMSLMLIYLIKH
jgi:hypothetical protein